MDGAEGERAGILPVTVFEYHPAMPPLSEFGRFGVGRQAFFVDNRTAQFRVILRCPRTLTHVAYGVQLVNRK